MAGGTTTVGRLAAALLLVGGAAVGVGAGEVNGMQAVTGEVREGQYTDEDGMRRYRLYVPASGDDAARPLVVMLHGCTQDAADFAAGTRADVAAERAGVLVLYPEQPESAHPQKCWSWYDPAHQARGAGEPALLAGLTRRIVDELAADPDRVFVAGLSAGGSMAQILAAGYPDLYRALAVHSAPAYASARDVPEALAVLQHGVADEADLPAVLAEAMGPRARRVPTLVIHGTEDTVVRAVNGRQVSRQWAGEHWPIEGLGHAWSGGSAEGTYTDPAGPDATARIFDFFMAPVPGTGR